MPHPRSFSGGKSNLLAIPCEASLFDGVSHRFRNVVGRMNLKRRCRYTVPTMCCRVVSQRKDTESDIIRQFRNPQIKTHVIQARVAVGRTAATGCSAKATASMLRREISAGGCTRLADNISVPENL